MRTKVWLSCFRQTLLASLLLVFAFYSQAKAWQCSINFAPGIMKTKEITDVLDMASNLRRGLESHLQKKYQQDPSQRDLLHREPLSIRIFFLAMTSVTVRRIDPDTSSSGETIPETSIKNSTLGNILGKLNISEKDFQNHLLLKGKLVGGKLVGQSPIKALSEMKPVDRMQENDPLIFEVNRKNESEGSFNEQMRALETQAISALTTDARNGNTNALHLSIEHLLLGAMTFSNPVRDFFVQTLKPTINWGIFQRWRNWRNPNNQVKFERETEFLQGRIQWAIDQVRTDPQGERIWPTSADAPRSYMQGGGYEPILRPSSENSPSSIRHTQNAFDKNLLPLELVEIMIPLNVRREIYQKLVRGSVIVVSEHGQDIHLANDVILGILRVIQDARENPDSKYRQEIPEALWTSKTPYLTTNGDAFMADTQLHGRSQTIRKEFREDIENSTENVILYISDTTAFMSTKPHSDHQGANLKDSLGDQVMTPLMHGHVDVPRLRIFGANDSAAQSKTGQGWTSSVETVRVDINQINVEQYISYLIRGRNNENNLTEPQVRDLAQDIERYVDVIYHKINTLDRYRHMVDRAFDEIDQMTGRVEVKPPGQPSLIENIVFENTGRPLHEAHFKEMLVRSISKETGRPEQDLRNFTLKELKSEASDIVNSRVIGYNELTKAMIDLIFSTLDSTARLTDNYKPVSIQPIVGPPGIAKTLFIEILSVALGMKRVDLRGNDMENSVSLITGERENAFQNTDNVNEQSLATAVLRDPFQIIYFNEANLGGPTFFKTLEGLMDGQTKDSQGHSIALNNAIVFLDFNPGQSSNSRSFLPNPPFWKIIHPKVESPDQLTDAQIQDMTGFVKLTPQQRADIADIVRSDLGGRPSLQSRLLAPIVIGYLKRSHLKEVIEVDIKNWNAEIGPDKSNTRLEFSNEALEAIVGYIQHPAFLEVGARIFTGDNNSIRIHLIAKADNMIMGERRDAREIIYRFDLKENAPQRFETQEDLIDSIQITVTTVGRTGGDLHITSEPSSQMTLPF